MFYVVDALASDGRSALLLLPRPLGPILGSLVFLRMAARILILCFELRSASSSSLVCGIISIGKSLMNLVKSRLMSDTVMFNGLCSSTNQSRFVIWSDGNKYFYCVIWEKASVDTMFLLGRSVDWFSVYWAPSITLSLWAPPGPCKNWLPSE